MTGTTKILIGAGVAAAVGGGLWWWFRKGDIVQVGEPEWEIPYESQMGASGQGTWSGAGVEVPNTGDGTSGPQMSMPGGMALNTGQTAPTTSPRGKTILSAWVPEYEGN